MLRTIAVGLSLTGLTSAIDCNVQTNRFDQLIFPRNGYFSRNQGQLVNSQIDINANCWLQWSGWSGCTGMCGNAVKTARRKCRNGIPGLTGTGCDGSEIKRRRCEPNEMVQGKETYCPYWSFWSEWGNCNVEASLDPCVRNMQGFSQRVRECHDPFATSVGEIPTCQGEPAEARACTSNQVMALQIPNDQRYLMSDWSECSVQCGQGVQEMTLTHVCANTPGTWVSSTEFYQVRSQACITACCVPGQWNYEESIDECTGGFTRKWRLYEDFAGGCAGVPNIKFIGGQYVEEEMLQVPIAVPNDWQFPFIGENEQWSGCVPQPSPYEGNVLTTCGVNGIQTRTRRHPCVATCTSENCVWNRQPFVITEQRSCGEQTVFEMRNTCNTNPCNPKCYQRVFCEGERQTLTQVEVECPQNVCGIPEGVWIEPKLCTCAQTEKFRTWQHQCDQVGGEAIGCSPPGVVCKFSEWQESQQLILARNNNQCICAIWEDFYDLKQEQCDQLAEDNRICSQFVGQMETRINAYASDICPGDEICEPCTRTCDMPNENPEIVNCHRQDICNPGVMVPSRTYTCPRKESCCTWGPWTIESECITGFTCPSEAIGQVRREIRYNTCDQIQPEIREATCPPQACPIWNEFGDWSLCSGVLADGTVCGGNRFRTRDYPCKQDVIAGNCMPQWPTGYSITDGNYDDLYNQFDSYSQQHHSQYCYDLYLKSETVVYSAWTDFVRDTENSGCVRDANRIQQISTRQKTDKCTGEAVIETRFKEIEVPACFDEGFVGAESCVYDNLGCTAQIKTRCIAQDVCGQSFERMSAVMATPEQCPPKEELVESFDSACMQVRNDNFLSESFCVGQAERTTRFKCQGAIVERVGCNIEPRWSPWSEFVPLGDFDANYAVEYRTNVDSFTQSVMCNPCGGMLGSTRQLLCSTNEVEEQFREINCPSPTYVWGPWSDCQIGCKQRPSDTCIENRFQTTTPEAMHCGLQIPQETREIPIPPCECQTQETERFCQHMDDPLATCGLGHVHEKTYYHTTNCVTGEILNTKVAEHVHGLNGQYEECALPFQPEYQFGAEIGCMKPEEICLGGVITQSKSLVCPQNSRPPYGRMWEATIIEQTGETCPGAPRVFISDWQLTGSDCMANECQTYRQEFRECVGGLYMDNCNCIEFGRECCLRNPEYQLSDDGTREYRSVACPVRNVLTQIDIQDPDCECGVCEVSRCNQDRCTGEITGCYIYIQAEPVITTISEWSDCQWNLLVGEDKCDIEGYRTREITTKCRNNRILNEIEVETWQPSYAMSMTDNNNLVPQPVYNGLPRCMHVPERRVLVSDCINVDSCNPYRVVQYLRVCDGIEIETESRQEACQADETVDVTAWTECSVECGENGIRTRQHIRRCSGEIVKVDEEACGCGIAYWSDWTQPDGICDGCGAEVQYLTQSRTCISPQARVYNGGDSYVNWMRNGGYNGYVPIANADQCAGKCNQCTPDTDGNANIRKMAYNRDSECSIPAEVVTGTCPSGEALCYTRNTFEITSWCGKEISRVEIPCGAPPAPPAAIESQCSVVCGEGVKTITSYNSICDNTPVVSQVPCIGKWGKLVQASSTEWSSCSATCGGGSQQRYISTVCELNPEFEVERLVQKQNCALHPCAYWGGWSGWSICSSTCGGGVRQRQRKCEGGNPGTGACTEQDEIYEDLFTGDRSLFSPSQGGSIHQDSCNEGDCCAFEWSGWSNCCMNGQNRARQIKWKGNACTGEWIEEDMNCVEADIDMFGELPTCDAILSINKQYFTGYEEQRVIISETLQTINGNTVNRGWDQGYGKFIEDEVYVIEGVTYELENVGGVQKWYMIGQNQVRSLVEVEVFEYNKGLNLVYYYKFGDRWYRWMNGKFAYTGTPPFYQSEVQNAWNTNYQWNGVNGNIAGNFNGNLINSGNLNGQQWQTNYVMSNPTSNQFTYTNGASSIPFYRPVTSITDPVVVRDPVVTEIVVDNGNVNGNFNNGNFNFGFNSMFG